MTGRRGGTAADCGGKPGMARADDVTGHQGADTHWDRAWATGEHRAVWSQPEPWVRQVAELVGSRGGRRVLDIGCGIGRHTLMFAAAGFEVHGLDRSTAGIARIGRAAADLGLRTHLLIADFTRLPYAASTFDYVLAWNVVYHGDGDTAAMALADVARVLRPAGLFQTTMLSKRNSGYGAGHEIGPDTYVRPDGPEDKRHPHLYSDTGDILRLHASFRMLSAVEEEQAGPGDWHWHLLFEDASHGPPEREGTSP